MALIDMLNTLPCSRHPEPTAAAAATTAVAYSQAGLPNLEPAALLPYVLNNAEICHRNAAVVCYFGQLGFPAISRWLNGLLRSWQTVGYNSDISAQVQTCVNCIGETSVQWQACIKCSYAPIAGMQQFHFNYVSIAYMITSVQLHK